MKRLNLREFAIKETLGIKIGVCSAAKKEEILSHLKNLGIEHLLDIVLFTIAIPNDYTRNQDFGPVHWRLESFAHMNPQRFLKSIVKQ